jgi:hypothetical protein
MSLKTRLLLIVVTSILSILPSLSHAQCSLLTDNGIYDYKSTRYDAAHFSSFVNWFRSQEYDSYETAKAKGFSLAAVVKTVPVKATYNESEEGFREFKRDIESFTSDTKNYSERLRQEFKVINSGVIEAVERCLSRKGVVHAWLEIKSNPAKLNLAMTFNSPGSAVLRARITSRFLDNVKCTDNLATGKFVYGNTERADCTRIDPTKPVTITLNSNVEIDGAGELHMPGTPQAAPVALTPRIELLRSGGTDNGSACISQIAIPAGKTIQVYIFGAYNIPKSSDGDARNGVSTADKDDPTRLYLHDEVTNTDLKPPQLYEHPSRVTAVNRSHLCVAYPRDGVVIASRGNSIVVEIKQFEN